MASSKIYTLDWSGKRLNELMAAVGIPDEDFCRELGLKPKGLARWREEGVPKKYMKRVAKLLGWNLIYPDFEHAPIGTWVAKKQKEQASQPPEPEFTPESFRVAAPEEVSGPVAGFKELVEAVTQKKVDVLIHHEPPVAPKIPLIRQSHKDIDRVQRETAEQLRTAVINEVMSQRSCLEDLARQQIVATPTLEQKPRKPVGFRND